jgi:hypothetical protein
MARRKASARPAVGSAAIAAKVDVVSRVAASEPALYIVKPGSERLPSFPCDNPYSRLQRIYLDEDNKNMLFDEISTIDHALTRPWTVVKKYVRDSNVPPIWYFNECAENNPLILVGKESYYISQDGSLMPVKKGQRPPDIRYFELRRRRARR